MEKRIKQLRKELGLTQQELADKIGIKRTTIATYESGRNTPIDAVISLICREFNVNEEWLREGSGDMFRSNDRYSDIARLTSQLLNEESDSFKNRFISMLARLNSDEWEFLEKCALELCGVSPEKAG
ncbi:helix-turn-helix transcriptional regulator [Lachnospiraceae bacterium MD335]|nr:helix-turn-helix transcriptional regulator [Lachnospiraceae bacterium MD335]